MLAALEEGVKGDVWFSLVDKVWSPRALQAAWAKVRANGGAGGVDGETVRAFDRQAEERLARLHEELHSGAYRPQAVRRVYIPKPDGRQRPLGIPTVRDRIVQGALRQVLEPIFEREFTEHSYGFRPGRGCKDALRRVDGLLQSGYRYVVDADLKSYFDTIPHGPLMRRIEERVADGRVLALIQRFLKQGLLEDLREWTPGAGTPQGAVLSPLLANIYLHPLDVLLGQAGHEMTRYADDFVVLCRSADEARQVLETIGQWVNEAGLTLHPEKTRIVDMNEPGGFDFLGYHFERTWKWPRKSSLQKFKDAIRSQTRRTHGQSLEVIIGQINPIVRGWYGYFKHSLPDTFRNLDGWIRMRLRSILRKRSKRQGRGRGRDHQRWPNVFFQTRGLFTMSTAHASERQGICTH